MRKARYLLVTLLVLVLALPALARAQGGTAKLVGYAALPAAALADGPTAGNAFAAQKTINGIRVPFDSQPVGTMVDLIPGGYPNTWLALSNSHFDTAQNSGDYLLRIYTLSLDLRRSSGGAGDVSPLNWQNLTDPSKKIKQGIKNTSTQRVLTGTDFSPRAFQLAKDGTLWVAEANGPSLLHFSAYGKLVDAPIALTGAGALQGMSMSADGKSLIIAQKSTSTNAQVVFRTFNLSTKAMVQASITYTLTDTGYMVNGFSMINTTQAVVIEQDGKSGSTAAFKQIYLTDLSASPAKKTAIIDLLNIPDPNNLSGSGTTFSFPYSDVGAIYPADDQTLLLVNNNHVPFGKERGSAQADPTEYIAIQLDTSLNVDQAFLRPLK